MQINSEPLFSQHLDLTSRDRIALSRCIIFYEDHVLLIQQKYGYAVLPGGHVETEESVQNAVRREVKEELDLELKTVRFLGFFDQDYTHERFGFRKERMFLFQSILQESFTTKDLEGNVPFFVSLSNLSTVNLRPNFLKNFIQEIHLKNILEELKSREPIFHHPEKFGKTKEDMERQMCDEFWEVGASGNVYTKKDVVETLLERYQNPDYQDIWEAKDFALTKIAPNNYLLTYILIQDKTRVTRRSTLWRRINSDWKILYHQGTLIEGGSI